MLCSHFRTHGPSPWVVRLQSDAPAPTPMLCLGPRKVTTTYHLITTRLGRVVHGPSAGLIGAITFGFGKPVTYACATPSRGSSPRSVLPTNWKIKRAWRAPRTGELSLLLAHLQILFGWRHAQENLACLYPIRISRGASSKEISPPPICCRRFPLSIFKYYIQQTAEISNVEI
jgi:hypothetical protein